MNDILGGTWKGVLSQNRANPNFTQLTPPLSPSLENKYLGLIFCESQVRQKINRAESQTWAQIHLHTWSVSHEKGLKWLIVQWTLQTEPQGNDAASMEPIKASEGLLVYRLLNESLGRFYWFHGCYVNVLWFIVFSLFRFCRIHRGYMQKDSERVYAKRCAGWSESLLFPRVKKAEYKI